MYYKIDLDGTGIRILKVLSIIILVLGIIGSFVAFFNISDGGYSWEPCWKGFLYAFGILLTSVFVFSSGLVLSTIATETIKRRMIKEKELHLKDDVLVKFDKD